MKFGTLRIRFLDGTDRDYPLELPSAVVGRGEGVSIVIDDFSISRRHAALIVESSRLMVEDLGSSAGTFLNGERLTPHQRYLVDEGVELRIGDLEAVYYPPPPTEAAVSEEDEKLAPGGLHMALISPSVPVDAGKFVTATLTVTNRSRIVDDIVLTVPQLPAEWYTISNPQFSLVPNAREEVQITIHPPRRHDSLAGEYDFAVHVNSREQEREFIAAGSFTVLPYESATLNLSAMRARRDFKVIAENLGNAPIQLDLFGRDDEQAFRYRFAPPSIELQPGEKAIVPLRVDRHRQLFGPPSQPAFETIGKFHGSGSEITARGQLAINPPLEKFKMPSLLLLGAIILAFTAIAVLIVADGDGVQTAGAESEYAGVHLCDDPGPENEDSGGGSASDGTPRPDATIAGSSSSGGTAVFGSADDSGAPFFAQNDPRWADVEYARSTELPSGKDWCGTTIAQCGCAMTSVGVMLALYGILELPDGSTLSPQSLNEWFNGEAKRTERGWVSRGYIYGDVIWAAANAISGEIAKANPGTPTVRFVRKGTGSEDEIRAELRAGRPVILEVPGHWIAAVGLDGDTILINDPFYRDRTTLDVYAGKVRSSVIYEPSNDLSAVVLTAPSDVKFRVIDSQGRVVDTGSGTDEQDAVVQIPGASVDNRRAWRDPTCIEQAPPPGAGTNQIVLPGNPDDYTIEILDTGGQPGSVAVHTYGRDGSSSIATIDTEGAATAELSVDPETGTSQVEVTRGGTPTPPPSTPTPGGAGGGDEATPTPTIEPTQGPPPTPTPTPFEEATTNITLGAEAGQTRVETASNEGFELGDPIRFAPGQPNEEDNIIVGFGSMLLATPLKFAHGPGEVIERLPRPPGQGPGLPPGITPPPDTGPLEPPSTVGLACSTIYQPSPKLATFICDLQVTGEYTTTRWTLNGEMVQEFTGSNSFLMTFPDDTPASISASVCNVTICRSVSRQESIDFGTGLGSQGSGTSGSGSGTSGSGSGTGPTPTPVPQGQVVVVCQTAFPISADGQSAQFTCEANFSGDYTSIAWSAPGGTPANKSGIDKTFETFIRNEPGAPVSLSVTATVCNFGTCITSQPRIVGIGRTAVILDSVPIDQVHNGHRLTLMARVQGIQTGSGGGAITPQGGTVQFYVDPPFDTATQQYILEPASAFGPSAPLFTTGDVAVAQVSVDTSNLDYGGSPTSDGVEHTFIGVYSGGTNAFGSSSAPRNIFALPPIPDGCDSVDEDDPLDGIVDNTCRNVVESSSGFSVAGGYAVPKNLGGGTVVTAVNISSPNAIEVSDNTIVVEPNAPLTVSGNAGRTTYCPGCIRQLYIGIGGNETAGTTPAGPICVASGGFPLVMNTTTGTPNPGAGFGWSTSLLKAPAKPGVYYVRATTTLDYFCVGPQVGPPENSIARIIVTDAVSNQIDVWNAPSGTTLQDTWTDVATLTPANEVGSTSRIILRARFNLDEVPSGRVVFSTNPSSMLSQPGGGTLPSAQICPASGSLTIGSNPGTVVTCTPGEARVVAVPAASAQGMAFTVTARLQTETLVLPHPINTTGTQNYNIRTAATPDVTTSLTVLVPSQVGITIDPDDEDDFEICANSSAPGCVLITLRAMAGAQPPINLDGDGGEVDFYYRDAAINDDSGWVLLGTDTSVVDGEATFQVTPGFETGQLGDFEFQARFRRGTTNLEPSSSAPSSTVSFIKAVPTVTVTGVSPTAPTIGDQISVTATVSGSNGYEPTGGEVQFRVRPSSGAAGTEVNFGSPVSLTPNPDTLVWSATLTYSTGQDGQPISNAGSYVIVARFLATATLAQEDSSGFNLTMDSADPSIFVCFPSTGGATQTVGDSALIRVILVPAAGSQASRLNDNSAYIEFRHNGNPITGSTGSSRVSVSSSNISGGCNGNDGRGAEFNVQVLAAGTYNVTAHYSGNNYYSATTSDPAQTLTINKFVPTVTMNSITAVQVGANLSLSAEIVGSGLRSPAGGSISFYLGSVSATNLLGTDTSLSVSGSTYTAELSVPTGGTDNGTAPPEITTAGTAYTVIAVFNGNATNGNLAESSTTANSTNSKSVTLTKRTPTVTMNNQTATLGSLTSLTATVASGSAAVSPDCTACVEFRLGSTTGTLLGTESVGGGTATLANVATGSGTPFTANGNYTIWAIYAGNTNVNGGNDSGSLAIAQPVTVTVSGNSTVERTETITLTATLSPNTAPGTVQFKADGANIGGARPVTSGVATYDWAPTVVGEYDITAEYTSTNSSFQSTNTSNTLVVTVTAQTVTITVSVDDDSITLGGGVRFTAEVSPSAAPGTIQFRVGGTNVGTAQTLSSGQATFDWTPTSAGTFAVTATYASSNTTNYASQSTSNSVNVTVSPVAATVVLPNATGTIGGSTITLTAGISPSSGSHSPVCTGCVTFRRGADVDTATSMGTADVVAYDSDPGTPGEQTAYRAQITITPGTTAGFTTAGTVTVWAVYGTSTNGNVSGGNDSATVTLSQATPTVQITSTNSPVTAGTNLTFNVTVSGSGSTSPAGGTVTLFIGTTAGTNLGTSAAVAADGTVTLSIATGASTNLPASGTAYSIVARFNGNATNGNVGQATSTAVSVTVNAPPP